MLKSHKRENKSKLKDELSKFESSANDSFQRLELRKNALFEYTESLNSNTRSINTTPAVNDILDENSSIFNHDLKHSELASNEYSSVRVYKHKTGNVDINSSIVKLKQNAEISKSSHSSSNLSLVKISCSFCKQGAVNAELIKSKK